MDLPQVLFLDTNILDQGWPQLSVAVQNLLEFARKLGISICIPDPTMKELDNRWRQSVKSSVGRAKEDLAKLEHLDPAVDLSKKLPDWRHFEKGYQNSVSALLGEWKIDISPFPSIPLEDVFVQAIEKSLLFEDKGKNFQDVVILHSAIEYSAKHGARSWLVTGDKAFEERKKDWSSYAKDNGANLSPKKVSDAIESLSAAFNHAEQERIASRLRMAKKLIVDNLPVIQASINGSLEDFNRMSSDLTAPYLKEAVFNTISDVSASHIVTPPPLGEKVRISAILRGTVSEVKLLTAERKNFEVGIVAIARYHADGYELIGVDGITYGSPGYSNTIMPREFKDK